MTCKAKQHSDLMYCADCVLAWDMNDDDAPECQRDAPSSATVTSAQTRLESLLEVTVNIFIGWLASMAITVWIVVPLWDLSWSLQDSFSVTVIYTVAAVVRGYCVRRFFDAQLHKLIRNIVSLTT